MANGISVWRFVTTTAYVQSLLGHHHYIHFYQFIILSNNL